MAHPVLFTFFALLLAMQVPDASAGRFELDENELVQELQLTADQKNKLRKIQTAGKDQFHALREKREKLKKEMEAGMQSTSSKEDLRKIHTEMRETERKLKNLKFEQILSVRELLTPIQRAKFKKVHDLRRNKRRNHSLGKTEE